MTSSRPGAGYAFEQFAPPPPRVLRPAGPAVVAAPPTEGALREAERIVAAARAEAEEIRAQARLAGHAEGYEAGVAESREELRSAAEALAAASAAVKVAAEERAEQLEREAAELGIHIGEKVLAGTLDVQPWRVMDVVRGALRCLVERERVTVHVNPADLELVREAVETLRLTMGGIDHLEVQEERRVARGGAVVRSATGEVDARLETKLQRVREVVAAELTP